MEIIIKESGSQERCMVVEFFIELMDQKRKGFGSMGNCYKIQTDNIGFNI